VIALLSSLFVAALVGSPHCAGMCGGFVAFYAGQGDQRRLLAHAAYNGGRLISYALLGVVAGLLGAGVEQLGATAGVSRAAAIVAGALMVLWGAATIAANLGARLPKVPGLRRGGARFAAALRALSAQPPPVRALVIGLLSTLLPCGFLYVFVAAAGATASPLWGGLVMVAFWAGTVPILAGLGLAAQSLLGPLQRRLPVVTAAALIVLGLLTMAGRLGLPTPLPVADCCKPQHAGH
jgi:uncharacterized protein